MKPRDAQDHVGIATNDDFLDQIDYVANLVGVDHVGIGTDILEFRTAEDFKADAFGARSTAGYAPKDQFVREEFYAEGISSIAKTPNITRGLVARGYSDQEIGKILGENFLRLFDKVWK